MIVGRCRGIFGRLLAGHEALLIILVIRCVVHLRLLRAVMVRCILCGSERHLILSAIVDANVHVQLLCYMLDAFPPDVLQLKI